MTPEKKTGRGARPTDPESVRRRTELEEWQRGLTDSVVSNILKFRDQRGMSNDDLRQRLSELDWDLTKDSLASILAGSTKRKTMPLGDVFLFAQALNVPPVALIFPTNNEQVVVSPKQFGEMHSVDGYLWLLGRVPPQTSPDRDAFREAAAPFDQVLVAMSKMRAVENMNIELIAYGLASDETGLKQTYPSYVSEAELRASIETLALLRRNLADKGIALPPTTPNFRFVDEDPLAIPPRLPIARSFVEADQKKVLLRSQEIAKELRLEREEIESREAFVQTDEYRAMQQASHDDDGSIEPAKTRAKIFELYEDKSGNYRFRLKSGTGEVITVSEPYNSKASALKGIESLKESVRQSESSINVSSS